MKKKILFLMQMYPPVHGASTVGENIKSSKIINDKFDCEYIRISTKPIDKGGLIKKIKALISLYVYVYKLLKRNHYDLVYLSPCASGYEFYKDYGLCMLSKLFCKNVIYHFHNKGISTNKFVNSYILKGYFSNVSVILSSPLLYYDIEKYVTPDKTFFIPYGIPDDNLIIAKQRGKTKNINLIFFAHMMKEKGVFDLLGSCKILEDKGLNFHCNFVGGWYDISENEFNAFINSNSLTKTVSYLGPQYGENKNKVLSEADIFVFPTYYNGECFPLGLLEAMRHELPIVTTNEGAIPDIIDNEVSGFIIGKRDVSNLVSKLEYLINNPMICKQMGEAGRKKYEQEFTLEIFENRMAGMLAELVK